MEQGAGAAAERVPERPMPPRRKGGIAVEDAAAWVLRVGVIASVTVMLAGLILSLARDPLTPSQMARVSFTDSLGSIWRGLRAGQGFAIMEVGVILLVLTPAIRVATSMVLFAAEDRDWLYTAITFCVLVLVLTALLLLH